MDGTTVSYHILPIDFVLPAILAVLASVTRFSPRKPIWRWLVPYLSTGEPSAAAATAMIDICVCSHLCGFPASLRRITCGCSANYFAAIVTARRDGLFFGSSVDIVVVSRGNVRAKVWHKIIYGALRRSIGRLKFAVLWRISCFVAISCGLHRWFNGMSGN